MRRRTLLRKIVIAASSTLPISLLANHPQKAMMKNNKTMNVGILLFHKVEELDFVGPLEVVNVANEGAATSAFNVFTISLGDKKITGVNNLQVLADYDDKVVPSLTYS